VFYRSACFVYQTILLLVLLTTNYPSQAQFKWLTAQKTNRDSLCIKPYAKTASVWLNTATTATQFALGHLKISSDQSIKPRLISNNGLSVGGGFSYGFLTAEYGFLLPSTLVNPNDRARTSRLALAQTKNNFRIEVCYAKINGLLYMLPDSNGMLHPVNQLGHILYKDYSATFSYFFNYKRFSYRAANSCSERQTHAAGSIITDLTIAYRSLYSKDSATINSGYVYQTDSGNMEPVYLSVGVFSSDRLSLVSKLGYSYHFVWSKGKWSLNPMLSVIVGTDHAITPLPAEARKEIPAFTFVRGLSWAANLSYNHPDFYVMLNYKGQTATNGVLLMPNATVSIQSINLEFGYRFKKQAKKWFGIL